MRRVREKRRDGKKGQKRFWISFPKKKIKKSSFSPHILHSWTLIIFVCVFVLLKGVSYVCIILIDRIEWSTTGNDSVKKVNVRISASDYVHSQYGANDRRNSFQLINDLRFFLLKILHYLPFLSMF